MKRNCTYPEDFHNQANVLKKRFIEKGCDSNVLDRDLRTVSVLDRKDLLVPRNKNASNNMNGYEWSFLTTFSSQYWWVNRIFRKPWQVLKCDKILGPTLPNKPKILFRRNR